MDVFDLVAKLTLDTSEYEGNLDKAQDTAEKGGKGIGDKLKTAGKIGGAAVATMATAIAAAGTAVVKTASQTAEYGDNIDKMSQKLGMSAEAYQEWDAIMQHSGASIDSMQRGMTTLSSAAEKGSDAFEAVGLSLDEVASMNQEQLFSATITALQNMEAGTERTVLAQKLLGGSAKELGALLNTSAEDTEAMRQKVHELGGVMSDEAVKAAAQYQDSLQDMQTAFSGLGRNLTSEFLPSITKIMDGLAELFTGKGGIDKIKEGVSSFMSHLSDMMPKLLDLGTEIIITLAEAIVDSLPVLVEKAPEIIGKLVVALINLTPKIIEAGIKLMVALAKGIIGGMPQIISSIGEVGKALLDGFLSLVAKAKEWGADLIGNFVDGIKSKLTGLWNTVRGIGSGIKNLIGFSEPKEGPLSDFHTYAPDMMKLFAQGIKENEHLVTDQLKSSFNFGSSVSAAGVAGGSTTNTYNITVNGIEELDEMLRWFESRQVRARMA